MQYTLLLWSSSYGWQHASPYHNQCNDSLDKSQKKPNHTWPTLLVGSLWMNHWLNPYIRYVLHANHQKNTRVDCEGGHLISPRRILPKLPNQQNRWKAKVKLLSPRNHFSKWYHLKWMTRNYWVSDIGSLLSIWKASLSFSGTVRSILLARISCLVKNLFYFVCFSAFAMYLQLWPHIAYIPGRRRLLPKKAWLQ